MTSIIKFGLFVRQQRLQKGWTQLELSVKAFDCNRYEFIGKLERGKISGITFNTADRIMHALGSELDFREFER